MPLLVTAEQPSSCNTSSSLNRADDSIWIKKLSSTAINTQQPSQFVAKKAINSAPREYMCERSSVRHNDGSLAHSRHALLTLATCAKSICPRNANECTNTSSGSAAIAQLTSGENRRHIWRARRGTVRIADFQLGVVAPPALLLVARVNVERDKIRSLLLLFLQSSILCVSHVSNGQLRVRSKHPFLHVTGTE